jgi:hypothetical protein
MVEPRQLLQQIADICADPEIVKLSGIYPNTHGLIISKTPFDSRALARELLDKRAIQADEGGEAWMVFLVKGEVAPAVRRARLFGCRCCRPAAKVHDLDVRREENPPAARAYGRAKVDILRVHEVALVEKANGFRIDSSNEETRAAHPVRIGFDARRCVDTFLNATVAPIQAADEPALP